MELMMQMKKKSSKHKLLNNKASYKRFVLYAVTDENFYEETRQRLSVVGRRVKRVWSHLDTLSDDDRLFIIDTAEFLADMNQLMKLARELREERKAELKKK
jgi:hypothetical protein